jgi:hypothetical protein
VGFFPDFGKFSEIIGNFPQFFPKNACILEIYLYLQRYRDGFGHHAGAAETAHDISQGFFDALPTTQERPLRSPYVRKSPLVVEVISIAA